MVWNLCYIAQQQMYLLEEHPQPQILMASWLIIYIVIAYQKWQVFTPRAAAYYQQKQRAPFILVIKTNKPVPSSGRKKKDQVCNIMIPDNV